MITVVFEASTIGAALTVEANANDALIDICDAAAAPVPFSCRDASCGTCLIEIVEGDLDPIGRTEMLVLLRLGAPQGHRLACRARIAAGRGLIRIRVPAA